MILISPTPVSHVAFLPIVVVFVLGLALLMVSNLPYPSFKQVNLRRKWPATTLFLIAVLFSLLTFVPTHVLAILLATYILSAPFLVLTGKLRRPGAQVDTTQGTGNHTSTSSEDGDIDEPE
jgi:phosphatidylserine synthase